MNQQSAIIDEFLDVCREILPRDHGVSRDLAVNVADQVYEEMESTRPRDARRVAELTADRSDVDELVTAIG